MFENRERAASQSVQGPNGGNIRPTAADIETTAYGGVQDAAMHKLNI